MASSNLSVYLSKAVKRLSLRELLAKFNSSAEIYPVKDLRVAAPLDTKILAWLESPETLSPNNPLSLKLVLRATAESKHTNLFNN